MTQTRSDRALRTPWWPVAYCAYANGHWRAILATVAGNGRAQLGLYDQSAHAAVKTTTLSPKLSEVEFLQASVNLMEIPTRGGDVALPEGTWARGPIKPTLGLCRSQRHHRFVAQFFWVDKADLHIRTFFGDGTEPVMTESHQINGDPTRELTLGDSVRRAANVSEISLLRGLCTGRHGDLLTTCPQMAVHDLTRLMPASLQVARTSPRFHGSGALGF